MPSKILICFLLIISLLSSACSTIQENEEFTIAGASMVGAGVGYSTSPKNLRKEYNAAAWAGIFGLATYFAIKLFGDKKYDNAKLIEENKKLREMSQNFKYLTKGKGYFTDPITGKRVKGTWKIKEIHQWIPTGKNTKVHQDKEIELIKESEEKIK
ncbi:MAG: hypothetical protein KDD33_09515 [Bdellovibrionales bacterium]|nr:hypothetical protein [Bdellovibrionales bacterium]